jgi:hypothetical protein
MHRDPSDQAFPFPRLPLFLSRAKVQFGGKLRSDQTRRPRGRRSGLCGSSSVDIVRLIVQDDGSAPLRWVVGLCWNGIDDVDVDGIVTLSLGYEVGARYNYTSQVRQVDQGDPPQCNPHRDNAYLLSPGTIDSTIIIIIIIIIFINNIVASP